MFSDIHVTAQELAPLRKVLSESTSSPILEVLQVLQVQVLEVLRVLRVPYLKYKKRAEYFQYGPALINTNYRTLLKKPDRRL